MITVSGVTSRKPPHPSLSPLHLVVVAVFTCFTYLIVRWVLTDPVGNLDADWLAFDNAGSRLREGSEVYRPLDETTEPLPYLYPPFALWLAAPLGYLGFWGSFLVSAVVPLAGYYLGLAGFRAAKPTLATSPVGPAVLATCSGTVLASSLIGQYAGLYVGLLGTTAWLLTKNRPLLAGVVLSLLWLKPNIAIGLPFLLIWARNRTLISGYAAGTLAVFLSSTPFGFSAWSGFMSNAQQMANLQAEGAVPFEKMVTVLSTVHLALGTGTQSPVSLLALGLIGALFCGALLVVWRPGQLRDNPVQAISVLALFFVAASPRLYFYDALLGTAGMFGLWLHAQSDSESDADKVLTLAAGLWITSWGAFWPPLNLFVGPLCGIAVISAAKASLGGPK